MESLPQCIRGLMNWDWSSIIQSGTGIATLVIAWIALSSWRTQHKSQKITELLDQLTDSVHEFIQAVSTPIQRLQFIHIGIDSCQYDVEINRDLAYPEAIRFIEKEGKENAERLMESLIPCEKAIHKIRSLIVKGQVYDIENYLDCQNACNLIAWQYDRLQVVYSILSSGNMNWEHPKVIERVKNLLEITSDDIEKHLKDNQIKFIKFVKSAYKKEYKNA